MELLVEDQRGRERRIRAREGRESLATEVDRRCPRMSEGQHTQIPARFLVGTVAETDGGQLAAGRPMELLQVLGEWPPGGVAEVGKNPWTAFLTQPLEREGERFRHGSLEKRVHSPDEHGPSFGRPCARCERAQCRGEESCPPAAACAGRAGSKRGPGVHAAGTPQSGERYADGPALSASRHIRPLWPQPGGLQGLARDEDVTGGSFFRTTRQEKAY